MATLRENPARFYSVAELADMWGVQPATVRWYLRRMRRAHRSPTKDQFRLKRLNAARRWHEYRADYAILVQDACITRSRPL